MTTTLAETPELLDQRAAIFVPSRYGSGQPIPPETRGNQLRLVSGLLAHVFGGASAEDIAGNAKLVVGTFHHTVDSSDRFVDEEVWKVWAAASLGNLADEGKRSAVMAEACRLQSALEQESVLVEWGREVLFTPPLAHPTRQVAFSELSREAQASFALMAWHRVADPESLCGVLALGGWRFQKPSSEHADSAETARSRIAWLEGSVERVAWSWKRSDPPREADLKQLAPGDLLVKAAPDSKLSIWLRTKERWAGPRDIPLATESRPTTRTAIEFVIAALEGDAKQTLAQFLDAEGATARFYRDVRDLISAVAKAVPSAWKGRATGFAQRLLGRLIFLRFVEEKGWLPSKHLLAGWEGHTGTYYRDVLLDLFMTLNTPEESRAKISPIPYLNGGLFAVREEDQAIDLPDELFGPVSARAGVLSVLYRYQFTLDEAAGREHVVSVDPAMLGRVLESLSPDETRKNKGVHYTPAPIARALALGGILPQLVRRAKAQGLTGIDERVLERLCSGDRRAVTASIAEKLQKELRTLKIVDPAVGSGALLLACLEVLLELEAAFERVRGGDLRRGSSNWAERARHFVKECLYGVDISPEAVEVAQLRFWLFLAVGEESATALPDLGYNLRVGNSLAFDVTEERLATEMAKKEPSSEAFKFDDVDHALHRALGARMSFSNSGGDAPAKRSEAFRSLEEAERELRVALGAKPGRPGDAPPFAWAVHFAEVFQGPNRGFDLVIANPPYVRGSSLVPGAAAELKSRYRSMRSKNIDLYFAFVERCLWSPASAKISKAVGDKRRGLAGRAGGVAFILPSFAQSTSAENLRELLAEGGHVERWVDFLDQQVFPTATNYVALLFATAEKRKNKTFTAQVVTPDGFARMRAGQPWLEKLASTQVPYRPGGWSIRPEAKSRLGATRPLAEIATVQVGIQTSLDPFYLFALVRPSDDQSLVVVRNELDEVVLERAALFACAKGARDLHEDRFDEGCYVLWPYAADGSVMAGDVLESRFPRAWQYLLANRPRLEEREKGKFKGAQWWRFRRPQGVPSATQPKVLVPSLMQAPTAFHDRLGAVVCTASGKGGGGGWVIQPAKGTKTDLEALANYLRSDAYGEWLRANAEPKKGGWWGVDRKTLERCPVPITI